MLSCLNARRSSYQKGEIVIGQGDIFREIPVLVEGELHIQNDDFWGNRSIIGEVVVGEIFGEAYSMPDNGEFPNDVIAVEESVVIWFDIKRVITVCASSCQFHQIVIQNLFFSISDKNRKLIQKLGHMSKRSTREKVISYLSEEAKRHNSSEFVITFNRQQLADYLAVDRSAMSRELSKMREEGILDFHKNKFHLL